MVPIRDCSPLGHSALREKEEEQLDLPLERRLLHDVVALILGEQPLAQTIVLHVHELKVLHEYVQAVFEQFSSVHIHKIHLLAVSVCADHRGRRREP